MSIKEYRMGKCNFVLPTVFNDAISYYEALCKICEKTNEIVDTINDMQENLPIKPATATVLGGILADPATTDDEIPVHIGIDNKLYTKKQNFDLWLENGEGDYSIKQINEFDNLYTPGKNSCSFNYLNSSRGLNSATFGYYNNNYGTHAFVEGADNTAHGQASHTEGWSNRTLGYAGHTEGIHNITVDTASHTEGDNNYIYGYASHGEGAANSTTGANNRQIHIEGYSCTVESDHNSHVEGNGSILTLGLISSIGGYNGETEYSNGDFVTYNEKIYRYRNAMGVQSSGIAPDPYNETDDNPWILQTTNHIEGYSTRGDYIGGCHAEGNDCSIELAEGSHVEGFSCEVSPVHSVLQKIVGGHAEGGWTKCGGMYSHTEGCATSGCGLGSHAEGVSDSDYGKQFFNPNYTNDQIITEWETEKFSLARGEGAHVEGANGLGLGNHCHVEGNGCIATNNSAHAEGTGSRALGKYSHAGGLESIARGGRSFTHGDGCEAIGDYSFAINRGTKATANYTFAGGRNTNAKKQYGFGYGYNVTVENQYGTVFGYQTTSNPNTDAQFVCGKWNKRTSGTTDYDLLVVGCGSSTTQDNAFSTGVRSGTKYIKIGSTELTEAQLTSLLAII